MGEEYESAVQDLQERYQRFKFSSFPDEGLVGEGSRDPILEFLDRHPSLVPEVAFGLANVIFDYVFDRLDHASRILEQRPLTDDERQEGYNLLDMLSSVNELFQFDKNTPTR
jgi:hypothetical protein